MTGTPTRSLTRNGHCLLWVLTELGDEQLEALIFRYYRNSRGVIYFCTRPNCTFHGNSSGFFVTSQIGDLVAADAGILESDAAV